MENKKKIKRDYLKGLSYKKIQKKYNITHDQLLYLIHSNKWKRESNRSEVQKGNKNAVGNSGGHAPKHNKNALVTGEYESIFSDFYDEKEKAIAQQLKQSDEMAKLEQDIELYTIREKRMLERIKDLKNSNKDMTIQSMARSKTNSTGYDGIATESSHTYAESTVDKIQRLEESLTRVQQARVKAVDAKQKLKTEQEKHELQKQYFAIKYSQEENEIEDTSEMDEIIYGKNN